MKNVLITGSEGVIGSVLMLGLKDRYNLIPLDKKTANITKLEELQSAIPNNTDVIIHLAWDTKPIYENGVFNNDNFLMTHNVFEAAVSKKIKRVILASSVHTNEYRSYYRNDTGGATPLRQGFTGQAGWDAVPFRSPVRDKGGRERQDPCLNDIPTSIYGATKVYFETLGRYYAASHGLEVVAIRFGGVNREDSPTASDEPDYDKIFLSHKDLITFVNSAIEKHPLDNNYWSFYAVSQK